MQIDIRLNGERVTVALGSSAAAITAQAAETRAVAAQEAAEAAADRLGSEPSDTEDALVIVSEADQVLARLDLSGVFRLIRLGIGSGEISQSAGGGISISGLDLDTTEDEDWAFLVLDAEDGIMWGTRTDGTVVGSLASAPTEGTVTTAWVPPPVVGIAYMASFGQSRAMGGGSGSTLPVITTAQEYDSLQFNGGARWWVGVQTSAEDHASFAPLVETANGNYGETPASGMAKGFVESFIGRTGLSSANKGFAALASAPAQPGTNIAGLSKGTSYYARIIDDVTYGKALADADGLPFSTPMISWIHGSADYSGTPATQAGYFADLGQLHNDLDSDMREITGRAARIPLIIAQIESHAYYGVDPTVALAQLQYHNEGNLGFISTPMYIFEYGTGSDADALHLTASGSKHIGLWQGFVGERVAAGLGWDCLQPTAHYIDGRFVVLRFATEHGLSLDTSLVTDPGNYGFDALDPAGNPLAFDAAPQVMGEELVLFSFASSVAAGTRIRAAHFTDYTPISPYTAVRSGPTYGARCCLRDNMGDEFTLDPTGLNKRADRYCTIFDRTID